MTNTKNKHILALLEIDKLTNVCYEADVRIINIESSKLRDTLYNQTFVPPPLPKGILSYTHDISVIHKMIQVAMVSCD